MNPFLEGFWISLSISLLHFLGKMFEDNEANDLMGNKRLYEKLVGPLYNTPFSCHLEAPFLMLLTMTWLRLLHYFQKRFFPNPFISQRMLTVFNLYLDLSLFLPFLRAMGDWLFQGASRIPSHGSMCHSLMMTSSCNPIITLTLGMATLTHQLLLYNRSISFVVFRT